MVAQLKQKIEQIQEFYGGSFKDMAAKLTESDITYNDLISTDDQEFWAYLCKKDFRRLEKLMTQQIGDGFFIDDSDEFDSGDDSDKNADIPDDQLAQKRSRVNPRRRYDDSEGNSSSLAEENDEIDHLNFIEQMLAKNNRVTEIQSQIEREAEELRQKEEKERNEREAKFADNNYWSLGEQYDIDDLMEELE